MAKNKSLLERIKQYVEEIYTMERYGNYVEVTGYYCGDIRHLKFYDNGEVAEK